MPITDYSNSIIYVIMDKHTRECVVGSTATSLAKRMYRHRKGFQQYNKWIVGGKQGNRPTNYASFTILQRNQYINFELEKFPCNSKKELLGREGYYIDKYKQEMGALCLNIRREGVNIADDPIAYGKQYFQDNKTKILANAKQYRNKNNDTINANKRQPYTCEDCNKTMNLNSKTRHWRRCKAREARLQQTKAPCNLPQSAKFEENKHKYNANRRQPYTCGDCNKTMNMNSKTRHWRCCKAREARLQHTNTSCNPPKPSIVVKYTDEQPPFVNTGWSSGYLRLLHLEKQLCKIHKSAT